MYIIDSVEEGIQLDELIRQAALTLGITVSDEAAEQELKERERGINKASRDIVRVELLRERLSEDYFEKQVPQSAEQRHIMAMFLESESQVAEVEERLDDGEEFNNIADRFMKKYEEDIHDDVTGVYGNVKFSRDTFYDRDDD